MLIGYFTLHTYCRHFVCLLPSRILVFEPLISALVFVRFKMRHVHSSVLTVYGVFDCVHFTRATDCLSCIYMVLMECFMRLLTHGGWYLTFLIPLFKMLHVRSSDFTALMCVSHRSSCP
jgi:hypothetical protein